MYEVMKVSADAPCASNVQVVTCEHARVGFYGFVWVQTSVVGSPSRTEELFRGLCLWCLSNITAGSASVGQKGCLLANIPVQFPHFPLFSICLRGISTLSTRPANNSRTLKTSTLRLFYSITKGNMRRRFVFASLLYYCGWSFVFVMWVGVDVDNFL